MSIFGGTAPLLALYFSNLTHSNSSPAFLLMVAAGISLFALLSGKKELYLEDSTWQLSRF